MNPFYFGASSEPLFGIYHPPMAMGGQDCAVLICPPLAGEYMRSHWALRRLADQLAKAGCHVLRFDYFGTGDSAGESGAGNVERWQNDILTAANELLELSGVRQLSMVGLRAGAALAATTNVPNCKSLVLWDPIINGNDYLSGLLKLHQTTLNGFNQLRHQTLQDTHEELLGYPLPLTMKHSIDKLDLLTGFDNKAENIYIFSSQEMNELAPFKTMLDENGYSYHANVIPDAGNWDQASTINDAILPGTLLVEIVNALGGKR